MTPFVRRLSTALKGYCLSIHRVNGGSFFMHKEEWIKMEISG